MAAMPVVTLRYLYSPDCPSHDEALRRLRKVLDDEAVSTEIEVRDVKTQEEAVSLRFRGSPTILVNGQDIDPSATEQFGLACRAYRLEDGRISPLPPESMIRRAIREANKS
jgi:hypothetical protein